FVLTLLTFWPPAPELRTKRIVSSRAGTRSRRSGIGARAEGRALRRAQHDLHDLGRRSETHRRPPEARAAADEEPRASALVLARDVLADQPHDVAERPELPAVRVSGDLQVDVVLRRAPERARVVREQHDRARRIASGERLRDVLAVA